jgi:hypothetical protein
LPSAPRGFLPWLGVPLACWLSCFPLRNPFALRQDAGCRDVDRPRVSRRLSSPGSRSCLPMVSRRSHRREQRPSHLGRDPRGTTQCRRDSGVGRGRLFQNGTRCLETKQNICRIFSSPSTLCAPQGAPPTLTHAYNPLIKSSLSAMPKDDFGIGTGLALDKAASQPRGLSNCSA